MGERAGGKGRGAVGAQTVEHRITEGAHAPRARGGPGTLGRRGVGCGRCGWRGHHGVTLEEDVGRHPRFVGTLVAFPAHARDRDPLRAENEEEESGGEGRKELRQGRVRNTNRA